MPDFRSFHGQQRDSALRRCRIQNPGALLQQSQEATATIVDRLNCGTRQLQSSAQFSGHSSTGIRVRVGVAQQDSRIISHRDLTDELQAMTECDSHIDTGSSFGKQATDRNASGPADTVDTGKSGATTQSRQLQNPFVIDFLEQMRLIKDVHHSSQANRRKHGTADCHASFLPVRR